MDQKGRETLDIGICVGNCKGKRGISSRQACIPTGYAPIAVFKEGIYPVFIDCKILTYPSKANGEEEFIQNLVVSQCSCYSVNMCY